MATERDGSPSASNAMTSAAEYSGRRWVDQYRGSISTKDLRLPFRSRAEAFIEALRSAGAIVSIAATFRNPRRAYLMHWSWRIVKQNFDPQAVPAMEGVRIGWAHLDKAGNYSREDSVAAAREMVKGFQMQNLGVAPALKSRHTLGYAIDMTISWKGTLSLMKILIVALFNLVVLSSLVAAERLPDDVRRFIERREGCDHFRGELPDSPDQQRMKEVNRELQRLCAGSDRKLAQLKKKYVGNPSVLIRLNEFDLNIEAASREKSGAVN